MSGRFAGIFLVLALAAMPGAAQSPAAEVDAALARLDVAKALVTTSENKSERIEALSEAVAAYEDGLSALRSGLRANSLEISALRTRLLVEEVEIGGFLVVLQSLGSVPVGADYRHPYGPLATVQSGISLAAALPGMTSRAAGLRARLDEIDDLSRLQDQAVIALRGGMAGMAAARAELIRNRGGDAEGTLRDTAETLRLGGESLAGVARLLAASPEASPAQAVDRGRMPLPVSGRVLRAFNARDAAGIRRPGIVIASRPGAPVSAPVAATVRFAGAFPNYAQVVILEVRPGELLVLAGMAAALVGEGESVAAGEIIALLAGNSTADEDNLIAIPQGTGSNRQETLYIETRENGEPVDPATWLDLPAQ